MFIKDITLKNFGSFINEKIELDKNGFYILHGINKDLEDENVDEENRDKESLGIGKSLFLESILWGTYGEVIREGLRADDLNAYIRDKSKKTEVEINYHNDFNIKRIKSLKTHKLFINEESKTNLDSGKKEIERVLISSKLFKFLNYFNPKTMNFFTIRPAERYNFIENLLNLDELKILYDRADQLYKSLNEELSNLNINKSNIQNKIENTELLINELKSSEKDNRENIQQIIIKRCSDYAKSVESEIKNISSNINNINNYISTLKEDIDKTTMLKNELINKLNDIEYKLSNMKDIEKIANNKNLIEQELRNITNYTSVVETYLKNPGKCPLCLKEYEMDIDRYIKEKLGIESYELALNKINELSTTIQNIELYKNHKSELNSINFQIQKIDNSINQYYIKLINKFGEFKTSIENIRKLEQDKDMFNILKYYEVVKMEFKNILVLFDIMINNIKNNNLLKEEIMNIYEEFNKYINEFINNLEIPNTTEDNKIIKSINEYIKNMINTYIKKIEENKSKDKNIIENYKKEKEEYENELKALELKLKPIESEIEIIKIIMEELGTKGDFKRFIISRYIENLNERYNKFVKFLTTKYKITLKLDNKNKGIDIDIYNEETDITKKYGQLSSGEKRLINVGLLLTLSTYTRGVLIIDEVLDNLHYSVQVKIIKLLKELSRQILYVTHNTKIIENIKEIFPDIKSIFFTMENDISTVSILN